MHAARISDTVGTIRLETFINAPIGRCFDLARSIQAHFASTSRTGERVGRGNTYGLLGRVGMTLRQGSSITRLEPPHVFVDESVSGPLKDMRHVHQFLTERGGTLMVDTFEYRLAFGLFGRVADRVAVERHLRRLLTERAAYLKTVAERQA